jgi:magnesium-transporting ATPase (P-type)
VVVLNGLFAFVQEQRAEHAAERLRGPRRATARAGSFVVEGESTATVVATGARTRLAGIARLTRA